MGSSYSWTSTNSSSSKTSVVRSVMGKKSVAAEQKIFLIFDEQTFNPIIYIKIIYMMVAMHSRSSFSRKPGKISSLISTFSFPDLFPSPNRPTLLNTSSKSFPCTYGLPSCFFLLSLPKIASIFQLFSIHCHFSLSTRRK